MREEGSRFHHGERVVQQRAGVAEAAALVGRTLSTSISSAAARFLARQRLVVAASLDAAGQPWASLLTGAPGFLETVDERLLAIHAKAVGGDPLGSNLRTRPELGLLAIDLETRGRLRVNGRGLLREPGLWLLAEQVYGNCPKYIQKRRPLAPGSDAPSATRRFAALEAWHREAITRADTFFVASFHPEGGADASHRGGRPGFVRVLDERRLVFPDYPGNNMFNTLGNLLDQPRAGLLFLDFERGDVVQVAGRAAVRLGPERSVELEVDAILETLAATTSRWELLEPSPSNP